MSLEEKVKQLEVRTNGLESLLTMVISNMGETRKAISEGFQKTDNNFSQIHDKIDKLTGNTKKDFHCVNLNLESIKEEIAKINEATGYEQAINNLRSVQGGRS